MSRLTDPKIKSISFWTVVPTRFSIFLSKHVYDEAFLCRWWISLSTFFEKKNPLNPFLIHLFVVFFFGWVTDENNLPMRAYSAKVDDEKAQLLDCQVIESNGYYDSLLTHARMPMRIAHLLHWATHIPHIQAAQSLLSRGSETFFKRFQSLLSRSS